MIQCKTIIVTTYTYRKFILSSGLKKKKQKKKKNNNNNKKKKKKKKKKTLENFHYFPIAMITANYAKIDRVGRFLADFQNATCSNFLTLSLPS